MLPVNAMPCDRPGAYVMPMTFHATVKDMGRDARSHAEHRNENSDAGTGTPASPHPRPIFLTGRFQRCRGRLP